MYSEKIENLIKAALADGELTEKEKQILFKRAEAEGIDLDEFEMVLDSRLAELNQAEKSAPKSKKMGDIKTCPACGAIVSSYQMKCPECGYEFNDLEANSSITEFFKIIQKTSNKEKRTIIENFPIPNTKDNLLEFLMSLQPKLHERENELSFAYFKKYEECIIKAKTLFAGDPMFTPFIMGFEKEKSKQSKMRFQNWVYAHWKLILGIIAAIIAVIFIIFLCRPKAPKPADPTTDEGAFKTAVSEAIAQGDLAKAESCIQTYTMGTYHQKKMANLVIAEYLKKDDIASAEKLNSSYPADDDSELTERNALFYPYYMNKEQFDKAEKFIFDYHPLLEPDNNSIYIVEEKLAPYYKFMEDAVNILCKKGKIEEAKKFIKNKLPFFKIHYYNGEDGGASANEYKPNVVKANLMEIVSSY